MNMPFLFKDFSSGNADTLKFIESQTNVSVWDPNKRGRCEDGIFERKLSVRKRAIVLVSQDLNW